MGPHHHSYSEQSVLRPLAYAVLSDLVQHVRGMLTLPQISKIVVAFSRVLHDATIPSATQDTSVKTLSSVVVSFFHSKDRDIQMGRDIVARGLRTFVEKLSSPTASKITSRIRVSEPRPTACCNGMCLVRYRLENSKNSIESCYRYSPLF
jgi:hypothetical protein